MCVWLASVCGAHIFRYKRTPRHWHWCWHRHAHNNHTLFCYRHSTADNDDTRYTLMCENLYRLVKPVSILYTLCAVFLCFSWYTSHNMYLFVCSFAYFFLYICELCSMCDSMLLFVLLHPTASCDRFQIFSLFDRTSFLVSPALARWRTSFLFAPHCIHSTYSCVHLSVVINACGDDDGG